MDECSWEHEDYLTLLARDVGGAVRAVEAYGLDEVLIERDSIVAFIDREVHRFDVWAWPPASAPAIVQTVQYGWAHEEDFERLALSPYCGP